MTAVTPERGEGLKPCPLCGGQARLGLTNRVERKGAMKDTMSAFCVDCSCMLSRTGPPNSEATKRQVAEAWNTRPAPSPATDEAVEVLREMLAGLDAYMLSGDAPSVGLKKQSLGMMPDRARSLLAALSSANARAKAAEEGLREMERRCAEYDRINLVGKTPGARRAGTLRNVLTIARTTLASMKEANHD